MGGSTVAAVTDVAGSDLGRATGKAIVLLSDGTGNSAAKLARTNVWRLYRALDLEQPKPPGTPRQIVFYDDGVGTSSFRPLALLGGIFGWGLKRNVIDLYKFLCRNYEPNDRIYAFGFSRGAFTVRVLVGLVCKVGLLRGGGAEGLGEEQLERHAADAYREYRKACLKQTHGHVRLLGWLRDQIIDVKRRMFAQRRYCEIKRDKGVEVESVEFVGVWDTVAAYGMPIAELTRGIDTWVWPLSMADYKLSPKVKAARHALALDDERDTFHPLLWDEVAERELVRAQPDKKDRLQQVWFAGMHADVGGGYADDSLAHVSLTWMIEQARNAGLRFDVGAIRDIQRASNEFGPMHDSRRGIAGYYRYQPRRIGARLEHPDRESGIMQDPSVRDKQSRRRRGLLTSVRIHQSVVNRMRSGTDGYAPIVLPKHYGIVRNDGTIMRPNSLGIADSVRWMCQERVWDEVWWRRIVYFATIGASLVLLALPALQWAWPPGACETWPCSYASQIAEGGAFIPDFLPGPLEPSLWTDAFSRQPLLSLILAVLAIAGFFRGTILQRSIHDRMRDAWDWALAPPGSTVAISAMGQADDTLIHRLRSNWIYQRGFRLLKWWIVPWVFGLGILWAGTTLATWALLGLAGKVLGDRMPNLAPLHVMAVGAVATALLVLIVLAYRPRIRIWFWMVKTFRRHRGATASLPT
jgi:uncharacterized protein (DUF2235 family)